MNDYLYIGSESGTLMKFDTKTYGHQVLYQHPPSRTRNQIMGLAFLGDRLYFSGGAVLGAACIKGGDFHIHKIVKYYDPRWDAIKSRLRKFWSGVGAFSRAFNYAPPFFHHMNVYRSKIYVTATEYNEVWELDEDLNLLRRIVVQPHLQDYNHLNNVFGDGEAFYVCLNRYCEQYGYGGYAKFDRDWKEVERRTIGWELHALCVVRGQMMNLCGSSGGMKEIRHPHQAGLMVNGELAFEHDPDKYFCKDFSMDDERIYIVGGESKPRGERGTAAGVVFVLNRKYELLEECVLPGVGGLCGCRLPDVDYSNGASV